MPRYYLLSRPVLPMQSGAILMSWLSSISKVSFVSPFQIFQQLMQDSVRPPFIPIWRLMLYLSADEMSFGHVILFLMSLMA